MKEPVGVNGRSSELVRTIDADAFRRNILALNAALTAAQSAGKCGIPAGLDRPERRGVIRAPER